MKLHLTYESRDTLRSFTLFITVKAVAKLNLRHRNKIEIEFLKISPRRSRSSDNAELVISRCCLAEDGKEMYKEVRRNPIEDGAISGFSVQKTVPE